MSRSQVGRGGGAVSSKFSLSEKWFWACDGSWASGNLWALGEERQLFSMWIGLKLLMCSDELTC